MSDQPRVREITPAEAQGLIDAGAALIDTREIHEWKAGHLAMTDGIGDAQSQATADDVACDCALLGRTAQSCG